MKIPTEIVNFDESPYFQSKRLEIYKKYAFDLLERGLAYYCFCTKEELDEMKRRQKDLKSSFLQYDKRCRQLTDKQIEKNLKQNLPYTIRIAIPSDRTFIIDDKIMGRTFIDSSLVDDQVIFKSDGYPTYHLAAVVDDHLMGISHVVRGQEWLSSTPKHIFLYESFGWKTPKWVHLPLILNKDRSKLSKRVGDFSVKNYLELGYLKQTILNYVSLLGWHPKGDVEIFSLDEMIKQFSFSKVNKAPAIFDEIKLNWMNGIYIRKMQLQELRVLVEQYFKRANIDISDKIKFLKVLKTAKEYIHKLPEIVATKTLI